MKIKFLKIILVAILLQSFTSNSVKANSTVRKDFFSYVTQCDNQSPVLQDFVEANLIRQQNVIPEIQESKSEEEILIILSDSLNRVSPLRNKDYLQSYNELKKKTQISEAIKIVPPQETDHLILMEGCKLVPVATFMQVIDTFADTSTNRVLVNKNIWDKLKLYEQVAIMLDFSIMKDHKETNLIPARIFTGYWFSNGFSSFQEKKWNEFVTYLKMPYFEYADLKIEIGRKWSGEIYYHETGVPVSLPLYKKNNFRINNQDAEIKGYITFFPSGRIEFISQMNALEYKLKDGDSFFIYASEGGGIKFFDDKESTVLKADLEYQDKTIKYKNHSIKIDSGGRVSFFSKGIIDKITFEKAEVKIRDKIYKLSGFPEDGSYKIVSKLSFYENGQIKCAESVLENQTFITVKLKAFRTTHIETLCFNEEGYVVEGIDPEFRSF